MIPIHFLQNTCLRILSQNSLYKFLAILLDVLIPTKKKSVNYKLTLSFQFCCFFFNSENKYLRTIFVFSQYFQFVVIFPSLSEDLQNKSLCMQFQKKEMFCPPNIQRAFSLSDTILSGIGKSISFCHSSCPLNPLFSEKAHFPEYFNAISRAITIELYI